MKQLFTLIAAAFICGTVTAQTDSLPTKKDSTNYCKKQDTLHIGRMDIIIHNKKGDKGCIDTTMTKKTRLSNVTTNWFTFDIGFSNYNDKTNYGGPLPTLVNSPGGAAFSKGDFTLKTGKSINFNLWFFMQRYNLVKHKLNLKYGLGLELNNYVYKSAISYKEDGQVPYSNPVTSVSNAFIFRDSVSFTKNKLAADYITVPLMLNFTSNPGSKNEGFGLSLGVSAGYLYSSRNKQKSGERGKQTNKGEYDLEKFKFSYIAEIGLGPIRLYGSYSPSSIYEKSLDMRPYTLGIRFSQW